jgi:hypothetical protein
LIIDKKKSLVTVVSMSRTTKITSLWFYVVIFCFTAFVNAEENKFPYRTWTSAKGQTFEGRLHNVKTDTIVIQAKQGGRRFEVAKDKISEKDNQYIEESKEQIKDLFANEVSVDSVLLYKSVALGIESDWIKDADKRTINGKVIKFKITTDKRTAWIEMEHDIYVNVTIDEGNELFMHDKSLKVRKPLSGGFGRNLEICKMGELKSFTVKNARLSFGLADRAVVEGCLVEFIE